jgi:hypothetical protein
VVPELEPLPLLPPPLVVLPFPPLVAFPLLLLLLLFEALPLDELPVEPPLVDPDPEVPPPVEPEPEVPLLELELLPPLVEELLEPLFLSLLPLLPPPLVAFPLLLLFPLLPPLLEALPLLLPFPPLELAAAAFCPLSFLSPAASPAVGRASAVTTANTASRRINPRLRFTSPPARCPERRKCPTTIATGRAVFPLAIRNVSVTRMVNRSITPMSASTMPQGYAPVSRKEVPVHGPLHAHRHPQGALAYPARGGSGPFTVRREKAPGRPPKAV